VLPQAFPLMSLFLAAMMIAAALPTVGASYRALEDHGLPKIKTAITGSTTLMTMLAVGLALSAVHQLVWGFSLLLYTPYKTMGALRCFIVSGCAHVCQTAAVAGPKRLSSDTYSVLNLALAIDSAVQLATTYRFGFPGWGTGVPVTLHCIGLFSALGAWIVGKTYKK